MTALRDSKLFSEMLAVELHSLEQTAQLRTYKAGRPIFQQGQPGDGLYTIVEGKVAITTVIDQDQRCLLARLGPGDFFGELALVDDRPRSATATAEANTQVYFIQREDLWRILKQRPGLTVSLLREFSARMRYFNHRYVEQVLQAERLTLMGKLAHTLVRQFKNPLHLVLEATERASGENATLQIRASSRDTTRKQVDRMNNLINEFLEFTRGRSSTTVLAKANYADFVKPLIEEIRSELVGRSVTVELENEPPDLSVLVDPTRLSHVFQSLVDNACDSMPAGGKIRMRFGRSDNRVITEIDDAGEGVTPEMADRLFEPFSAYAQGHGLGLELAICRRIIEDHHGTIQARSHPDGTTFIFDLPLARQAPPYRAE